jgi:hypothetical protein
MSSTARKTIDTDIITLRKVYARGDSNATIPSSFVLMSDGAGATSWINTSTITQPLVVGQNFVRGTMQDYSFDASGSPLRINTTIPLVAPAFYSVNVKGEFYTDTYNTENAGILSVGLSQSQGQTSSPSVYVPYNQHAGYIDSTRRNIVSLEYTTFLQTQLPWTSTARNSLEITISSLSTASLYTGLHFKLNQVLAQQVPTQYQFP